MRNPLKCPDCSLYRKLIFKKVRWEDENKGVGITIPFYKCPNCSNEEPLKQKEYYDEIAEKALIRVEKGKFLPIEFEYENKRFTQFEHLGFKYSSEDYYLIPGLYRELDDGYLCPVFFNKDVLLYYNNHPDYSVKLYSFSSGNIYNSGKPLFSHGFGINREGKLFMWLGDLEKDLGAEDMEPHLKRFQASNIDSDHDIYSKFYLSQIPTTPSDAFQKSDNENKVFRLKDELNDKMLDKFGFEFVKISIEDIRYYYRPPVLNDREQIFNTYISLNKYLVENIQTGHLKNELTKHDIEQEEFDGLGSLKTLELYLEEVLEIQEADTVISPLFVLNDLRQLQGHLSDSSFEKRYNFCKDRLSLENATSDFEVYKKLIAELVEFYNTLLVKLDEME